MDELPGRVHRGLPRTKIVAVVANITAATGHSLPVVAVRHLRTGQDPIASILMRNDFLQLGQEAVGEALPVVQRLVEVIQLLVPMWLFSTCQTLRVRCSMDPAAIRRRSIL